MDIATANRARLLRLQHSSYIGGETFDIEDARVHAQNDPTATGADDYPDLTWLGFAICICSAAGTLAVIYSLIDSLFF